MGVEYVEHDYRGQDRPTTETYTVDSTVNCIVWIYAFYTTQAPTSVTYDGNAMTKAFEYNNGQGVVQLWYYPSPATGSKNVVATGHDSSTDGGHAYIGLKGVDTADPLGEIGSDTDADPSVSLSTKDANGLIIDVLSAFGDDTWSISGGQTEIVKDDQSDYDQDTAMSREATTGGTDTVSYSYDAYNEVLGAAEFQAVSAAASDVPRRTIRRIRHLLVR